MVRWVGRLAGGWFGGWRSFRARVSAFVPVGRGAVILFGTAAMFCSLRYITGLLWRSWSTKQRIRLLMYCCSNLGGLVSGGMAWSVGGWVCRAVRGWCFVGELEADVVLVRLLCFVLLPLLATERRCCAEGLCCSRIKLR